MKYLYLPKEILNFHSFLSNIPVSASENGYSQLVLEFLAPRQLSIWASNQDIHIQYWFGRKGSILYDLNFQDYVVTIHRDNINNFIAKLKNLPAHQQFLDWDEKYNVEKKSQCSFPLDDIKSRIEAYKQFSREKQDSFEFPLKIFSEVLDIIQPFSYFTLEKRKFYYGITAFGDETWIIIIFGDYLVKNRRRWQ